jgi:uncharacterized membrane protein YfhO
MSGFDMGTDLGTDLIGSYSFYNMFSPFFLLSYIFPPEVAVYALPWILSLKYAVASLGAYIFIKRFVKNPHFALVGAFLYAFSGFQSYNIFFNHFHDVTALFPFMLIALEELIQNGKKGFFAAMVAVMVITNYFFFFGQVVFLIIYFTVRWLTKNYKINFKKFLHLAVESMTGVLISMAVLLPSYLFLSGNYRLSEHMFGLDYVSYYEGSQVLWRVIQSFFMLGDNPAWLKLFGQSNGSYGWSSIAAYLPLFSCVGVLAFILNKKYHWASFVTIICVIMSVIPFFNAAFYAFNSQYYARWWYMPLLIAAMMTASALEQKFRFKNSFIIVFGMLAFFGLMVFIPMQEDGKTVWFEFVSDIWVYLVEWVITVGLLILAVIAVKKYKNGTWLPRTVTTMTVLACFVSTGMMLYYGAIAGGPYPNIFKEDMKAEFKTIEEHENGEPFFRTEFAETHNYTMLWGMENINSFQSSVPQGTFEFVETVTGQERGVKAVYLKDLHAVRAVLSTKYYIGSLTTGESIALQFDPESEVGEPITGIKYIGSENGYSIFENEHYIPMGFTYDYYAESEVIEDATTESKSMVLTKAVVLDEKQAEKYADILEPLPKRSIPVSRQDYFDACAERAEETCSSFSYDNKGFRAEITLEEPKLVFFSIPYMDGFTAKVNGKAVDVEKVNYGMMAVRAELGENEIEFSYETPGLKLGLLLSGIGVVLLAILFAFEFISAKKNKK